MVAAGGHQRHQQDDVTQHVEREKAPDRVDDVFLHQLATDLDGNDRARMHQPGGFPGTLLEQKENPDHLHAPGGGPGASADGAHEDQQHRKKRRPEMVFGCDEPRGGHHGNDLHGAVDNRFLQVGEVSVPVQDEDTEQRNTGHHDQICAGFGVLEIGPCTPGIERGVVQREIEPGQQHEHARHEVDRVAVEPGQALVMGGESADGDGGIRMTERIEPIHARQPVAEHAGDGQRHIDVPELLGRFGNSRRQPVVLHRARGFRTVELHAPDPQHGHDRHCQHDDPHAAEPLKLLPVVQNGWRQLVDTGEHGGTGGTEPGHGLEQCVDHTQ